MNQERSEWRPALGLAKIPPLVSLSVTASILIAGVAYSLWRTRGQHPALPEIIQQGGHA